MPRRILAIETSTTLGSVALLADQQLVREQMLDPHQRSAASLAPAIEQLLAESQWPAKSIDRVCVAIGPGSFTGLRIGVTSAKVFAYATGAELSAVSTLEALAHQTVAAQQPEDASQPTQIAAVVDAYRNQLFVGEYRFDPVSQRCLPLGNERIEHVGEYLARLAASAAAVRWLLTGPILAKLAPQLDPALGIAPADCWPLRAATIGQLGQEPVADLFGLGPVYLRLSAAEEKRLG